MMGKLFFAWFAAMFLISCSPFRLQRSLPPGNTGWIMYGREMERANVAGCEIPPPLGRLWTCDVSSGSGTYGIAAADSLLFVGNLQGEIHIVRMRDGHELCSRSFGSAIFGAPVIDDDTLIVATSGDEVTMLAYILTTGKIKWQQKVGDVETSPLLMNRRLYVTTYEGKLFCLNKSTGEVVWTFTTSTRTEPEIIRSSPAGDGTRVVFGCDDGKMVAVSADSGKLLWVQSARRSIVSSPSISSGKVFVGSLDSTFYAFDLDSGNVVWSRPLGSRIFGSQAVLRSHVYVGTSAGIFYCLDVNDGTTIWSTHMNELLNTAPLVSDSIVYIGSSDKKLYACIASTGKCVWEDQLLGRMASAPVGIDGFLFVLDDNHTLYGYRHREE